MLCSLMPFINKRRGNNKSRMSIHANASVNLVHLLKISKVVVYYKLCCSLRQEQEYIIFLSKILCQVSQDKTKIIMVALFCFIYMHMKKSLVHMKFQNSIIGIPGDPILTVS